MATTRLDPMRGANLMEGATSPFVIPLAGNDGLQVSSVLRRWRSESAIFMKVALHDGRHAVLRFDAGSRRWEPSLLPL
jgi:hypothetical protein